jgi:hypothetical protein
MSRQNKVNKNNYTQHGRLTPDEMAHERINQAQISTGPKNKEKVRGKVGRSKRAEPESSRPRSAPEE